MAVSKRISFSPLCFSHSLKCQSRPKLDSNLSLATVLSEGRTNIFSFIFIVKVLSEAELSAISVKRKVPIGDPRVSIPRLVKLAQLFQHYFNYNRNSRSWQIQIDFKCRANKLKISAQLKYREMTNESFGNENKGVGCWVTSIFTRYQPLISTLSPIKYHFWAFTISSLILADYARLALNVSWNCSKVPNNRAYVRTN